MKKSNKEKEELKNNENVSENVNETETAGGCSPEGCAGCSGCGGSNIDPETIIQILGSRNQELEDKYMRLQAEYLNFKTRTQGEKS